MTAAPGSGLKASCRIAPFLQGSGRSACVGAEASTMHRACCPSDLLSVEAFSKRRAAQKNTRGHSVPNGSQRLSEVHVGPRRLPPSRVFSVCRGRALNRLKTSGFCAFLRASCRIAAFPLYRFAPFRLRAARTHCGLPPLWADKVRRENSPVQPPRPHPRRARRRTPAPSQTLRRE